MCALPRDCLLSADILDPNVPLSASHPPVNVLK